MSASRNRIDAFNLTPGRVIGGKYVVEAFLGGGWEGEVYRVQEKRTGARRAAKFFFPHRNERDRALEFYAKKLERLRDCSMVIQYHHTETMRFRNTPITCLISEFVDGELLSNFVKRQRGKRLAAFEALHLLWVLARGVEEIHRAKEYHGDLHDGNVLIKRVGISFRVKLVDFYHWGRPTASHRKEDVVDLVRLLYDCVGGRARYAAQPEAIRQICKGMRRDLIIRAFPTVRHLREHLEAFEWVG